jgi:hypothetical protein
MIVSSLSGENGSDWLEYLKKIIVLYDIEEEQFYKDEQQSKQKKNPRKFCLCDSILHSLHSQTKSIENDCLKFKIKQFSRRLKDETFRTFHSQYTTRSALILLKAEEDNNNGDVIVFIHC